MRVESLAEGGGLNGSFVLTDTTATADGAKDTLTGAANLDWFLADPSDNTDWAPRRS